MLRNNSADKEMPKNRDLVIVNQASNYLTVGFCNAFAQQLRSVTLLTGSVHIQGEELHEQVRVHHINRWHERPAWKKAASYLWASMRVYALLLTRYRKSEVLFISLPPMAYLLSLVLPQRCSMLIWDIYPDVFRITGMSEKHPLYRLWAKANRLAFAKAHRLFTIGDVMADALSRYVDRQHIKVRPIWSIFQQNERVPREQNPFAKEQHLGNAFVVQYSGNIGLTHRVEFLVELAEYMKDEEGFLFQIIGRGPRRPHLEKAVADKNLKNCVFLPFQSDEMFPYSLSAADVGVVVLDALTAKGSVPSKAYNLMSYGIPSLYIATPDSELARYAQRFQHAACFEANDLEGAAQWLRSLRASRALWQQHADAAQAAALHFRRPNADLLVADYLSP